MCGMFYVEDGLDKEIRRVLRQLQSDHETAPLSEKLNEGLQEAYESSRARGGNSSLDGLLAPYDVRPTNEARVLVPVGHEIQIKSIHWGIPGFQKGQLIINARSETVMEKNMFREDMKRHRILIPASGFYEWNRNREKNVFRRMDKKAMFMAGLVGLAKEEERFTILTTAANDCMRPVHDRMPLILEEEELEDWLFDNDSAVKLLKKRPIELHRESEYEQMSLF